MIDVALRDVEKYYGANRVLKGITFEVNQGEKIGLLGRNGAGKTTLFRLLANLDSLDEGSILIRKGAVIGMLDQIPDFPETSTVYDVLYSAFADLTGIRNQMKQLEQLMKHQATEKVLNSYAYLQQLFEVNDGYSMEENINRIRTGLKISDAMAEKEFALLSGGEKTRVMLGKLMLEKPDILLLDEPTNHLDLSSIEWLEEFLKAYEGTAIIISHDRYFLDRVVSRIVEIVDGKAELYAGNYSYYFQEKQERYEAQLARFSQEQKKIKQLEDAARRMHEWAERANNDAMHKRAFSIEKRIERMDKTDKPVRERQMNTAFAEHTFSGKDIVFARGLHKKYGDRTILDKLDLLVRRNERVAILGDNGSGKSTLMGIIAGEVQPDGGTIKVGDSARFAYLPQTVTFADPKLSILGTVTRTLSLPEGIARGLLARYKFRQEDVHKTVETLSGGEKSRLRLCIMMQKDVNLLLLDEPTNHLDIDSREWLENALEDFTGTLVFVSHDRYFIRKFADRISELAGGRIQDYYGDYEYFRESKAARQQSGPPDIKKQEMQREKVGIRTLPAKPKSTEGKIEIEELEAAIMVREEELKDINLSMENAGSDYEALNSLYKEKLRLQAILEELYEKWTIAGQI
ncbi:MAG TPA: ABC transporter ATP-binding protein [Firmicutes bacterium]|nr:ABC transporter ATP-binding protein [Bacillota bacterium]